MIRLALAVVATALAASCGPPCEQQLTCDDCVAAQCIWVVVNDGDDVCRPRGGQGGLDYSSIAEVAQECGPGSQQ